METVAFASAAEFAEVAFPYLERHEAEHNLVLGLTARVASGGRGGRAEGSAPPRFWAVQDGDETVGAALVTPPHDLALSRCRPGAAAALAAFLHASDIALPGVTGPVRPADELAAAWVAATSARPVLMRRERIYELRSVTPPAGVSGTSRTAGRDELSVLTAWLEAFAACHGDPTEASTAANELIANGHALLWLDPEPDSVAVWSRTTRSGASIGPVYTPPEKRGRGYGSAVTAALSAQLLAGGREFCCLYTDLGNSTSNRIYQRIGYRAVADVNHYRFAMEARDQDVAPGSATA